MGLTVYTGGSFDLFHSGHVAFLRRCKELAGKRGRVIVSLNTDEFILAYKGKGLVMNYAEREAVLEACRYVDYVMPNFDGADSRPAIEAVSPDLVVIGSDWARRDYYKQMGFTQDWLDEQNIALVYLPYTAGISSTDIKARLSGKL
jgi:glycerol-3-phosphate cytidylyltransferase